VKSVKQFELFDIDARITNIDWAEKHDAWRIYRHFRDRNRSTLDQCKFVEREVDSILEELLSTFKQTTLF
jgi:hypothetical protein